MSSAYLHTFTVPSTLSRRYQPIHSSVFNLFFFVLPAMFSKVCYTFHMYSIEHIRSRATGKQYPMRLCISYSEGNQTLLLLIPEHSVPQAREPLAPIGCLLLYLFTSKDKSAINKFLAPDSTLPQTRCTWSDAPSPPCATYEPCSISSTIVNPLNLYRHFLNSSSLPLCRLPSHWISTSSRKQLIKLVITSHLRIHSIWHTIVFRSPAQTKPLLAFLSPAALLFPHPEPYRTCFSQSASISPLLRKFLPHPLFDIFRDSFLGL